jgi:hypothetical protein
MVRLGRFDMKGRFRFMLFPGNKAAPQTSLANRQPAVEFNNTLTARRKLGASFGELCLGRLSLARRRSSFFAGDARMLLGCRKRILAFRIEGPGISHLAGACGAFVSVEQAISEAM